MQGMENARESRNGILSGLRNWQKIFGGRRKGGDITRGISMPSYEKYTKEDAYV